MSDNVESGPPGRVLQHAARRRLPRFGAAYLAVGAMACGQARTEVAQEQPPLVDIIPGAPAAPPVVAEPIEPPPPPPELGQALPGIANDENVALGDAPRTDVIALRVLELLETYCGACHANGEADGGFGDVLDIPKLIERAEIVPGSSATSPLLARMSDGETHPTPAPLLGRRPLRGELALLARFIDDLDPAPAPDCAPHTFIGHDDLYALLSADIAAQPAPDRPFVRYLDLTYASNAGLCGPALARQRHALFKLINSVSMASEIAVPRAIDSAELIYRIDLRDYGWDREIDVIGDGSLVFSDAWLALVAGALGYAPELDGPDANAVREHTGTAVPVLPVNAFVYTSTAGDLYYALVGVRGSLEETRLGLGVDIYAAMAENRVARAGFIGERRLNRESFVVRLEQTLKPERSYWYLEDMFDYASSSIFSDPFDVAEGGRQTIYSLPNGMQAYWVESEGGMRLGEIPLGCVGDCDRPAGVNAAACHSCHGAGLLPVADQVREYVQMYSREFDNETFAAVLIQYPTQAELDALMQRDSELHLSAVERAGVPRDAPDPISRVFLQFEREPLTLIRAAAELGVTPEILYQNLPSLPPSLQALGIAQGSIERSTFTEAFSGALCALRVAARNRPLGCP